MALNRHQGSGTWSFASVCSVMAMFNPLLIFACFTKVAGDFFIGLVVMLMMSLWLVPL